MTSNTDAAEMVRAIRQFLKENDMMAYLVMMGIRLIELHRVLKLTGSLYLHCDPTASHYLKLILDSIFGALCFRNEIVWQRSKNPKGSQHKAVRWGPSTDTILFYARSSKNTLDIDAAKSLSSTSEIAQRYPNVDEHGRWADGPILRSDSMGPRENLTYEYKSFTPGPAGWRMELDELIKVDEAGDLYWTSEARPRRKIRPDESELNPLSNCWTDIAPINSQAQERLGYPTQKPLTLLDRIIRASSKEGDVVLDPFCGCGTTIHAAQRLGRKWIGIDVTHVAIYLIENRIRAAFPGIAYTIHGVPRDAAGAAALATADKHQFQLWAVSRVGAQPFKGGQRGADGGIDGIIYFKPEAGKTERAIVSVKGGANVGLTMLKDLIATVDAEKAKVGVFVTLTPPTAPMTKAAVRTGFYEPPHHPKVPKIQILTVQDIFAGKLPNIPLIDASALKKPAKEKEAHPTLF